MAIAVDKCLNFDDSGGYERIYRCALFINEDLLVKDDLRGFWSTMELKKGSKYGLGDHGCLSVCSVHNPLVVEWRPTLSKHGKEAKVINENRLVNVATNTAQSTNQALTCRRHCHFSLFSTRPGEAGCAQTSRVNTHRELS